MQIFKFTQEQPTTFCLAIQSTEITGSNNHISNIYYGKNICNFCIKIQNIKHKVHLLQLFYVIYKSSIVKPYELDVLILSCPEGQSNEATLEENYEVKFNLAGFEKISPLSPEILSFNYF